MPALTATSRARASVDTGPDSWNLCSRISWMKSSSYGLAHGLCKDGWSNARLQPAEPELPSTQVQIGWNRSLRIRWMKSSSDGTACSEEPKKSQEHSKFPWKVLWQKLEQGLRNQQGRPITAIERSNAHRAIYRKTPWSPRFCPFRCLSGPF